MSGLPNNAARQLEVEPEIEGDQGHARQNEADSEVESEPPVIKGPTAQHEGDCGDRNQPSVSMKKNEVSRPSEMSTTGDHS